MAFRLKDVNTRFALPIVHPKTRETVSAEKLYNDCADAMGRDIRDHIGDLILDNFDYDSGDHDEKALCDAVYAWADSVHAQINASEDSSVFAFTNTRDGRAVVYGAVIGFSSPSDSVWLIPGTWNVWGLDR